MNYISVPMSENDYLNYLNDYYLGGEEEEVAVKCTYCGEESQHVWEQLDTGEVVNLCDDCMKVEIQGGL